MYELMKKLGRSLKGPFHFMLSVLIRKRHADLSKLDPKKTGRILIIRQHNEIGDVLMASPAIRAFKENFPATSLEVIVRPKTEEIAGGNSYIDNIIVFDKKKIWRRPWLLAGFLHRLAQAKYDIVVVLSSITVSTTSALFAWFTRADIRVGRVEEEINQVAHLRALFNVIVPRGEPNRPHVERNLDFLRALLPGVKVKNLSYEFTPVAAAETWADDFLAEKARVLNPAKMILLHPGAAKITNRWSARNYGLLGDRLIARGFTVLIDWSPGDEDAVGETLAAMKHKPLEVPLVNLSRLAALISKCRLFIGNDTGVLHLAASVGAPTLGLFGPTSPAEYKPLGKLHAAVTSPEEDIDKIEVGTVLAKAIAHLNSTKGEW